MAARSTPRRSRLGAALLALVAAVLVAACGGAESAPALKLPPTHRLPRSKTSHAIVIVMENKEYGEVFGSHSAPYFTRLGRRYAAPEELYGIRHPSLPNYLALVGGSTFGVTSDCTSCHVRARSVADQLEDAGRTWKAYLQGMPHPCYSGPYHGDYAKKHNPFMYFDGIAASRSRCRRVVPYSQLGRDLRGGRLPDFALITPDLCADTHDCPVKSGDRFLRRIVPALLRELGPHGFLVVTYDEGSSNRGCCGVASGGRIPTVIAGPDVRRHATGGGPYSTYSILRTVDDFFGLPRLGNAARAAGLDPLFRRAPRA